MKTKSAAHLALIEEARSVGVILPDRIRTQKALREAIRHQKLWNERYEARAEISRVHMPI